jgi:adenosyl cobinamide kinase/adenosyl cobinamide phosphate guanylyltransferase/molybdopterin-guanine dinucleotide biosynthesis protein A
MTRIGGIVLCGGQSSRMGRPKAWLPFGNELMLPRVVRLLGEVVSPIVVVAARGQDVPSLPPQIEIVRDPELGRGPLQGLAAGLEALRGRADAAYVSSCDVPFLRPAFVRRLIELLGDFAICVPEVGGRQHPLSAVYRIEAAAVAAQLLAADRLRPAFLFDEMPTRIVRPEELAEVDPAFQSLRNLNAPADYEAALQELQKKRIVFVGGGTRSGKSDFALSLARRLGQRRLFLATAQPGDDEMRQRIERHRRDRGTDFDTIEEPLSVAQVIQLHADYDVVLLDCLTLWLSNLLLEGIEPPIVLQRVEDLTAVLARRSLHAVVVSNEVGLGIVPETPLGRTFRDVAGSAHQRISAAADEVYFAVLGTILRIKPSPTFF